MNTDGFGKSPDAALRFLPRHCGVRKSTPHSSGLARLACGLFYEAVRISDALTAMWWNATHSSAKSPAAALRAVPLLPMLALLLVAGGCAGLPPLKPLDEAMRLAVWEECRTPFLPEKYRLVHSLEALLPDGGTATAIGILVADPRSGSFRSVLMTIEGMVLFDVESGAVPRVHRAVRPFDSPTFARRMAEDIGLAFLPPVGEPVLWGQTEKGFRGCRYGRPDGGSVDVLKGGGAWEIRFYGTGQELLKKVNIFGLERPGLAGELDIRGEGWPSYGLHLRLIEAEAVE